MALTKSFRDLVQSRMASNRCFGVALLCEGIDTLLAGDIDTGKTILRDYINAAVGFEKLCKDTDTSPKNLIRMFEPSGNLRAKSLFKVLRYLQQHAGIELHIAPEPR